MTDFMLNDYYIFYFFYIISRMNYKLILICFLLFNSILSLAQVDAEVLKYSSFIKTRKNDFLAFNEKLTSKKLCPGADFECLSKELGQLGLSGSTDVGLGVAFIATYGVKSMPKDCDKSCERSHMAQMLDTQLTFLSSVKLKDFFVYKSITVDSKNVRILRAAEDLTLLKLFKSDYIAILALIQKLELKHTTDKALLEKTKKILERLDFLTDPRIFQEGALANLPASEKREIYDRIVGNDKVKRAEDFALIKEFNEVLKNIRLIKSEL